MSTTLSRFVIAGLLFVLIFITGYWLSRAGKPYSVLRFNLHKFIGLGTAIFTGWTVFQNPQVVSLDSLRMLSIVITVLIAVVTVITGGLLSTAKVMPPLIAKIHKVFPFLTIFATAGTLYLLLGAAK
jgi:hypothetical protein